MNPVRTATRFFNGETACRSALISIVFWFGWIIALPSWAAEDKGALPYWENNFEVLSAADHLRVARAHTIFTRLRQVAGDRGGVVMRLRVIKDRALRVMALADGAIVLSSAALDACYAGTSHGDDRLAFILAHEIAHQQKNDFWHLRFFEAMRALEADPNAVGAEIAAVRKIAERTDQVLAKELEADEYGITYAAIAGFDSAAIVSDQTETNFFADWLKLLDPARAATGAGTQTHPAPRERRLAVLARLRQVQRHSGVFHAATQFYEAGRYREAATLYRVFLGQFASREVYHNLAVSLHQMALTAHVEMHGEPKFALDIALDPDSRADRVGTRGDEAPEQRFRDNLDQAIEAYRGAIRQDPDYEPAHLGLAAALILDQRSVEAIGPLRTLLKKTDSPALRNALGVAYWQDGDLERGRVELARAADRSFVAALFNLGQLARAAEDPVTARTQFSAYLARRSDGGYAAQAREYLGLPNVGPTVAADAPGPELLADVAVNDDPGAMRSAWTRGRAPVAAHAANLELEIHWIADPAMLLITDEQSVLLMSSEPGYSGKTARGIAVGASTTDLVNAYGSPDHQVKVGTLTVWRYTSEGVAFRLEGDAVHSWLLFRR